MATAVQQLWQPSSSFGWIDIDRDEAKRVREMLGLFKAPEAIDPHGILPLQIALSDRLFPGMSTQHTRVRYVMFSAWHAQRLAQHLTRTPPTDQLRIDELALMQSLLDSDDTAGVFGRRSREKTKTLPTSVYWSLLQRWEIIPGDMTVVDIQPRVDSVHRRSARIQASDDAAGWVDSLGSGFLDDEFPMAPQGFPKTDQSMMVTKPEAGYLKDRVAASCPDSFLNVVLTRPELADGVHPWTEDPDAGGQNLVDAQCFSELIHPARLLYTKLLVADARKLGSNFDDIDAAIDIDFNVWQDECEPRISILQEWAKERLGRLMSDPDVRLNGTRKNFIRRAIDLTAGDPKGCLNSAELAQQVRSIEFAVKRGNARLHGGEPFKRWLKRPARLASQRMDYRWGNVCRFVDDLEAAV